METLKKLEELGNPDERNLRYIQVNYTTGEQRTLEIKDIYSAVERVKLSAKVPEKIQSQFNVAKNLAIYSWFAYSFHQISDMKAFSTVEMALRDRLGEHRYSFKGLIKKAVNLGLINDSGFHHIEESKNVTTNEYSAKLPEIMPYLRNSLAQGSTTLHPGSAGNLAICADFINQLYENELR